MCQCADKIVRIFYFLLKISENLNFIRHRIGFSQKNKAKRLFWIDSSVPKMCKFKWFMKWPSAVVIAFPQSHCFLQHGKDSSGFGHEASLAMDLTTGFSQYLDNKTNIFSTFFIFLFLKIQIKENKIQNNKSVKLHLQSRSNRILFSNYLL